MGLDGLPDNYGNFLKNSKQLKKFIVDISKESFDNFYKFFEEENALEFLEINLKSTENFGYLIDKDSVFDFSFLKKTKTLKTS